MAATIERPLEDGWLPDTPVADTILRSFLHNQAEVNEMFAVAHGGRTERTDAAFLADAASVVPYLNQALLARPLNGADDPTLDQIESFFGGSSAPATLLSIWPTPDLSTRGWTLYGHPMFVVHSPGEHPHVAPDCVEVRRVADATDLATAERVVAEGYPMPPAIGAPVGAVLPPALLDSGVSVRLGLLDGEPVAAANGYVSHGVTNLCLAATLPAARRRGVWESLVWARVNDGPRHPAVAFTSDHSRPGFLRMGFLPVTRFTLWAR
jgi:hypothetical protein